MQKSPFRIALDKAQKIAHSVQIPLNSPYFCVYELENGEKYYGILPQGGATTEQATGLRRYLVKASPSGQELPYSKFTRRKKELMEFTDDSGKTVYFCIRYENSKGQSGPWGLVFSAVIP